MRVVLDILKRDLWALVRNPIVLFVMVALLVLPGLYAWYCIIANWDPYSNTGAMPIAVVNRDKGVNNSLAGEVNIGEQVVEKLEDNDSIDWRIYDSEEEALEDTRRLKVYATIVLPEDLSENLVGIFEGSSETPTIYYYPNEKKNAVATKVTDSAAQTLIREINTGFSSTVNKKILESTQDINNQAEGKVDAEKKSAIAEIKDVEADLDKAIVALDDAAIAIENWRVASKGADDALAATQEQLPSIREALLKGAEQLDSLRLTTDDFEGKLSATILSSAATVSSVSAEASATLKQAVQDLQVIEERLKALRDAASGDISLRLVVDALEAAIKLCDDVVSGVDDTTARIDAKVQDVTQSVTDTTNQVNNEVMPGLNTGAYDLAVSLAKLSGAIEQFEPHILGLRDVLSQTDSALAATLASIADAKVLIASIRSNLAGTVTDIGAITNALEIGKVSELLDVDSENLGTFVSSPVQMVTEKICPVSNYGTAVAPFYTNLALWVGCFILVSLIKVEVSGFPEATARQRYFGRWFLFIILSFLQSQVICGVDILLGIDCAHPVLFMLSGAVCSFVYMNLIYALVKTFRNIGKTFCIFLLIMQVPGSSGMYPIQIMPGFFQLIHPALPFTYGINAMREALSGLYGLSYVADLAVLLVIIPVSLFIGLGLRPLMGNLLLMFDEELSKTGFIAGEEYEEGRERSRLFTDMLRAAAMSSERSDEIEERAWRFKRVYPRVRKVGSAAAFAIPFAMLVLMLPFNVLFDLSTDLKLGVLIIMLVLLFIVQMTLIALEHMHRRVVEETRLIGADILGEDWGIDLLGNGSGSDSLGESPSMTAMLDKIKERRSYGGPARDIFLTDMKLGFQSVIGVVVILLLVVTPAMYAWFNIAGSWDPYSNTGNLKVAVVNNDEGYRGELVPLTINVGDTVISQLQGNDSFDWEFVEEDEAISGVESSRYYAAIVIPHDFSRNMMTYLTDDTDYPDVVYYTNQKENPIAPIITQKGATSIQEGIRVNFTERVDQVVLSIAYDVLSYVTKPGMSDYAATMSKDLDNATHDTRIAARELQSLSSLTRTVSSIVGTTGAALKGIKDASASARDAVGDAKAGIESAEQALDRAMSIVDEMIDGRQIDIDAIQALVDTALDLMERGSEVVPDQLHDLIDRVEELKKEHPDVPADRFDAVIESLEVAKRHADAVPGDIADARSKTDALVQDAEAEIGRIKTYFKDDFQASLNDMRSTLSSIMASTSAIVDGLDGVVSGIGGSTSSLTNQLDALSQGLQKTGDKLNDSAQKVEDVKKRVAEALQSGDLQQIVHVVIGGDPEAMAASLAVPIQEKREALYGVANFGSAMSSFYTVLSLWVGALVMISTMRVHVVEERIEELRRRYVKVRPRHEFFGRYGIFGFIGLLQSSLVLLGDVMFLHIQCENPVLFFLFGILIGQVFCMMVYTITELFGDVGKALCVILLIMQVAASGGTFPVQMLDPLLINFVPFLPFYHAMSLLQECVAGIYWPTVGECVLVLLAMLGVVLIMGVPLRRPFRKVNDFLERQLETTGYM